jgi:hypothetical protein
MTEGVTGDTFANICFLGGFFDGSLKSGGVDVVPAQFSGARIGYAFGGGEEILPGKFARGSGVFGREGVGQVYFSAAGFQVFVMQEADSFDLALEARGYGIGQQGDAVFFAFAVPDCDGFVFEVEVFEAQTDAFHEAQSAAI